MKSLPYFLKDAISEEFHFPHVKGDKNTLRLIEDQVPLASVDIKIKNSDNIYCFSFDKKRQPKSGDAIFPFFNASEEGLCTKNDYILVYQKGSQVYVFLIELKSKNITGYLNQLRAGKLFVQFIIDRIKLCNSVIHKMFDKKEPPVALHETQNIKAPIFIEDSKYYSSGGSSKKSSRKATPIRK